MRAGGGCAAGAPVACGRAASATAPELAPAAVLVRHATRRIGRQASEVLAGIEFWHMCRATLQTRKSRAVKGGPSKVFPRTVCGGTASLPL